MDLPGQRDALKGPSLPRRPLAMRRPTAPSVSVTFAPEEAGPVGKPQAGLDRRTADRLRKGAREPDARIDLHGMTADRAHQACLRFLGEALARGHRVVLVITGKGAARDRDGFPGRGGGVLRESLPGWLRASPLAPSVVGIYQAHQKHGGSGAFYVYLKKRR
ncbi:MAG: Smr/MutS family protein [Pseudomonadota bacterium]